MFFFAFLPSPHAARAAAAASSQNSRAGDLVSGTVPPASERGTAVYSLR